MLRHLFAILIATALISGLTSAANAQTADAETPAPTVIPSVTDGWDYTATMWGWLPSIKGDTVPGPKIDLSLSDILNNLSFIFFGAFQADQNKLSLMADGLYMDLKGDASDKVGVEMQAVVFNAGVAYSVYRNPTTNLSLYGGARYLWMKNDFDFNGRFLSFETSFKDDVIDGVVGFRGRTEVNDQWYATYFADVGTGQSDYSWRAGATMNYRFEKFDAFFGYLHTYWNFDGNLVGLTNLKVSGPVIGARFRF